jgi:hypothetical protein
MWYYFKADFGIDDTLDSASTRRLYTPSPGISVESSSLVLMQVAVTAAAAELPLVLKKLDEMVSELGALRVNQELMANELAQLKQQQRAFGCPDSAQHTADVQSTRNRRLDNAPAKARAREREWGREWRGIAQQRRATREKRESERQRGIVESGDQVGAKQKTGDRGSI